MKENLSFNRFQFSDTVCLEYNCLLDAGQIGIFRGTTTLVHVLCGKKTCKTVTREWTLMPGRRSGF